MRTSTSGLGRRLVGKGFRFLGAMLHLPADAGAQQRQRDGPEEGFGRDM